MKTKTTSYYEWLNTWTILCNTNNHYNYDTLKPFTKVRGNITIIDTIRLLFRQ